jgi:hypothetical protein
MDAKAKVYNPAIQVLVFKNVARTTTDGGTPTSSRFKGANRVIDLAPWLSETSGVRTSKSTREVAGGFTITLSDRIHPADMDSLYGLLEPMDLVEIRMSHEPHKKFMNGGKLPIIMRGFISEVRRPESIAGGGKPSRQMVITGQDYGKIWQILQIFYMPNYPAGENLITQFKMFSQYGVGFETQKAKDFLVAVILKVINPFIADMKGQGEEGNNPDTSPLQEIRALEDDIQTGNGIVSPFGINQWNGGTIYQLLHTYLDVGPFCELFLEDREDGVFVVHRQNPFYTLEGDKIPEYVAGGEDVFGFTDPEVIDLPGSDIQSVSLSRSDAHVANYYWVDSPRHELNYGPYLKLAAAQGKEEDFFVQKERNSNPKIYGIRKMWEQTQQGAPEEKNSGNGAKSAQNKEQETFSGKWIGDRRKLLVAQNKDNVVWEQGSMRIRGREDIRAGVYVQVKRGTMYSKYYVVQVDHEFVPFSGFFTTLHVERGNGFAERAKRSGGVASPYYSELSNV